MTPEQLTACKRQTEQDILESVAHLVAKFVEKSGGFQIKRITLDLVSAHKIDGTKQQFVANARVELDV